VDRLTAQRAQLIALDGVIEVRLAGASGGHVHLHPLPLDFYETQRLDGRTALRVGTRDFPDTQKRNPKTAAILWEPRCRRA